MSEICKGARFRVLTGDLRGREGVLVCPVFDGSEVWILNFGDGDAVDFTQRDADSGRYQRLADAPAEAVTDHARCEAKIREQADTIERMAASALDNARRYASDLAAERMAGTLRVDGMRRAIFDGATDDAQRAAAIHASNAVFAMSHGMRVEPDVAVIAPAYIAQGEALREARAEVERLRQVAREMVAP